MPAKIHTPEHPLTHWSRVQAAVLNRFNWPAKRKVDVDYVVRLSSEIADKSTAQYRARVNRSRKA